MSFLTSVFKAVLPKSLLPSDELFFRYSSGRWLYNEAEQLAVRRVKFNVSALQRVAAQAVGATRCINMTKTHEGSFSKVFLLEFDNRKDLIAKVPTSLIPPFYTTASEVATMDYAHNVLGIPMPRVLGWNARTDPAVNPVGAEYILMEKAQGDILHSRWDDLQGKMSTDLIHQMIGLEQRFAWYKFSQIGSLYYREDVESHLQDRPLYAPGTDTTYGQPERFRIGPLVDWDIWRGSRAALSVDRGPWPDAVSYLQGLYRIEQEWLRTYAKPYSPPFDRWTNDTPQDHIDLLEQLCVLMPYVVPPDISHSVLWHTDLHLANLFVEATPQAELSAIIDWQSTSVAPLFMQASVPKFLLYKGEDVIIDPGPVGPVLRIPIEDSPPEERPRLEKELKMARRCKIYQLSMERDSLWHYAVHLYPFIDHVRGTTLRAARSWYEGAEYVRDCVYQIGFAWEEIAPDAPLPIVMVKAEWDVHNEAYKRRVKYDARVQELARQMNIEMDGWVANDRYEEVRAMNARFMAEWDDEVEGGPYPFQDGAPSWFVGS
ncbi:hypothetical protein BDW22DRAFT_1360672 [Trametopsis cervina]|nr:hypothetical protein BDW22DRAFT_1360672 [Trametopsis cervina]